MINTRSEKGISTARAVIIAIVITAVIAGVIGFAIAPREVAPEEKALEIYHWWTSGGEKAAIDALVDVFKSEYPGVEVIQTPVAGGAGYVMKVMMKTMVAAGEAPDAFQMHPGYEAVPYIKAGYLEPVTDLWKKEGWSDVIPDVVEDMIKFDGEYYCVPVNIHRANLIWYNKPILDANGIDPTTLTTWDKFFDACDNLKAAGMEAPIALGDKAKWPDTTVLAQIIASQGIDFYEDWINGKDPDLTSALEIFKKYLGYVNADHAALTWDEAVARVITGGSAFNLMGDWAAGEFIFAGKEFGKEWGAIPVPGTAGMYSVVIDAFQHPKGVKHPKQSLNWLRVVGSKEGQDAFNSLKGSIPARTDADRSKYGPYQLSAIDVFATAEYMYPIGGSALPEAFLVTLCDITSDFVNTLDVDAAASAISAATSATKADFIITWSLH